MLQMFSGRTHQVPSQIRSRAPRTIQWVLVALRLDETSWRTSQWRTSDLSFPLWLVFWSASYLLIGFSSQEQEVDFCMLAEWKRFIRSKKRRLTWKNHIFMNILTITYDGTPGHWSPTALTCWAVLFPSWAETRLNVLRLAPLCWHAVRMARSTSLQEEVKGQS